MSTYYPDRWMIVRITAESKSHYRVFASWGGGFAGSDEWKLNSGITKVELINDSYHFHGESGSTYVCHKDHYGAFSYQRGVLNEMIEVSEKISVEIIDESVDPLTIEYK